MTGKSWRSRLSAGLTAMALMCVSAAALMGSSREMPPDRYPSQTQQLPVRSMPELSTGEISVNLADVDELTRLPGIGAVTAAAIVAERELHGAYRYPEDLLVVHGLGVKKLNAIRDLINFDTE